MTASHSLFIAQFIAHMGLVWLVFKGEAWQWLVAIFVYFLTGCFGMSMTYHRLLSHRSWKAPKLFEMLGTLLGTLGLTGSALAWAAIHRQHHAASDRPLDPHSPVTQPWWRVQFFSMYYKPNLRYVKDLLRNPYIVFCHRNYFSIQIAYVTVLLLVDVNAVIYAYLAPAAILWHGGSLINSMGHMFGYRNFQTRDRSVNNPLLGIFMWGEGWHNNHHAKPFRKSFRVKFWEIDLSAFFISLFESKKGSGELT